MDEHSDEEPPPPGGAPPAGGRGRGEVGRRLFFRRRLAWVRVCVRLVCAWVRLGSNFPIDMELTPSSRQWQKSVTEPEFSGIFLKFKL